MKKVLILQIKGKTFAGVWQANRLVGEALIKRNYIVNIVSIRNNQTNIELEHDPKLIVKTINEKDTWETYHLCDFICELKQLHIIKSIKILLARIKYNIILKKDIKKLHEYIYDFNPDYIIASHYQLLDMIPKEYLKVTIHQQHSSYKDVVANKSNKKTFNRYNHKIKFLWLTKGTMNYAIKDGYTNSSYIYNAVRIRTQNRANVIDNKKLIAITRLSKDKRIDTMIEIVESIFKDKKYKDWVFEIYGTGDQEEYLNSIIKNKKQIKLMGLINNPEKYLLSASINLNASKYEGFSLTILEANECGIPTVAFDFGESAQELIINNKTGLIVKNMDEYQGKLKKLMDNPQELERLSVNVKEFSSNFNIDTIIKKWLKLFQEIDKNNQ